MDIFLDPRKAMGVSFVSHAHSDHVPKSFSGTLIASKMTCSLSREEFKGECWHTGTNVDGVKFSLYNSGHIPGSSQLMIENGSRVLYSGDMNLKGGLITPPAETPRCDVLILETTFGAPRFVFPDKAEVVKEMKDWANGCLSDGRIPVFLGYSLGKAQELTHAFSKDFTVFVDDSIYGFNKRVEELGIALGEYLPMDKFSADADHIIIVPPHKAKDYRGDRYSLAMVSGWAVNYGPFSRLGASTGFPLSDHSDFHGLLEFVERVSPQVVYTTHGYAKEFSRYLRDRGFYSEPLSKVQTKLNTF